MEKLRLDKWLWAARFFKTRALAKKAIEGGKIRIGGQRPKVSRDITPGLEIIIRQGWDEKTVIVEKLTDQRRGSAEACQLYTETSQSIADRENKAMQRKLARESSQPGDSRPSKKQRRQIHRFREQQLD